MAVAVKTNSKCYKKLCEQFVQSIFESGLLVDDDFESVLSNIRNYDYDDDDNGMSIFKKLLVLASATGAAFTVAYKYPIFYTGIASAPLLFAGSQKLSDTLYAKQQKCNILELTDGLRDICRVNFQLIEYFKMKESLNIHMLHVFNPYTKGLKKLIKIVFEKESQCMGCFKALINKFSLVTPWVSLNYGYLDEINFEDFTVDSIVTISDCLGVLKKFYDIFVLLSSNCLTCLAVMLTPYMVRTYKINVEEIFDNDVPFLKNITLKTFKTIDKTFDETKFYQFNSNEVKKVFKPYIENPNSFLQNRSHNMMVHASEILEITQRIYKMLSQCKNSTIQDKESVCVCLRQLRCQVSEFHDILEMLIKLYENNINRLKPPALFYKDTSSESSSIEVIEAFADADPDNNADNNDPLQDQEFELIIGPDDEPEPGPSQDYAALEEAAQHWAMVVNSELKYKLKTHRKFVAAKRRRGSLVDERPPMEQPVPPLRPRRQRPEFRPVPRIQVEPPDEQVVPPLEQAVPPQEQPPAELSSLEIRFYIPPIDPPPPIRPPNPLPYTPLTVAPPLPPPLSPIMQPEDLECYESCASFLEQIHEFANKVILEQEFFGSGTQ